MSTIFGVLGFISNPLSSYTNPLQNCGFVKFVNHCVFIIEAPESGETAIEQNNFEELNKIAHKIKGSSSNLRIEIITQLIINLQNSVIKKDKEECFEILQQIKNHIEYLNAIFLKFIQI